MTRILPNGFDWCLVTDLDGTLANCDARRDKLQAVEKAVALDGSAEGGDRKWSEFMQGQEHDPLIVSTYHTIIAMQAHLRMPLIICTARAERFRPIVEAWLGKWNIHYYTMLMRPDGDHRPDVYIKEKMLLELRLMQLEPYMVWDDRNCVVEMWRKAGIVCHQVNEGDF